LSGTRQHSVGHGPQESLKSRLKRGLTWNIAGSLFSQATLFLCNVVLANILGRTGYGEFGMIQNTVLTLAGVAQFATGFAATKYIAEFRFTDKARTGKILGLCSLVTGVMGGGAMLLLAVCASWLATFTLKAPHLGTGLLIAAVSVLFSVQNGYQVGALAGLESYRAIAKGSCIHGILHLAVCCVCAFLWGLNGALAGFVISSLLRWWIFSLALHNESVIQGIAVSYKYVWQEREIILKFALPAALSGVSSMLALWAANTFLVRQAAGFSHMGLYSAANSFRSMILFLPLLVNNVGMSLLNSQKGAQDEVRYKKVFWFNLVAIGSIAVFGAAAVSLSGSWILRIFGKDFVDGYKVLLILVLSTIPESLAIAAAQVIQSREKMWLSFFAIALPKDAMILMLAYRLTPDNGAAGLAWAYTVAWSLTLIVVITIVAFIGIRLDSNRS